MVGGAPKPIKEKQFLGWIINSNSNNNNFIFIMNIVKEKRIAWISADYRGDSNMDVRMTNIKDLMIN